MTFYPQRRAVRHGDLHDLLDLQPQKSETFVTSAAILEGFSGPLCNTAEVLPPPGIDPNPTNDSATACVFVPPPPGSPQYQVPALSPAGLALLASLLSAFAVARLRRGARRGRD